MPRRRAGEIAPTATWPVVTIDSNNGDKGSCLTARDETHAREHFAWLIRACTGSTLLLQARAGEGDDWIMIERHPSSKA